MQGDHHGAALDPQIVGNLTHQIQHHPRASPGLDRGDALGRSDADGTVAIRQVEPGIGEVQRDARRVVDGEGRGGLPGGPESPSRTCTSLPGKVVKLTSSKVISAARAASGIPLKIPMALKPL